MLGGYQPNIPVLPVLQLQDGSYVGSVNSGAQNLMMAFDATGGVKWASPNYSPSIATADGGVIAPAGGTYDPISQTFIQGNATTFDANGNATGQVPSLPTFSWKGVYQSGLSNQLKPHHLPSRQPLPPFWARTSLSTAQLVSSITSISYEFRGRLILSSAERGQS